MSEEKNEECELIKFNDAQYTTFGKEFLKHYLSNSYGAMSKKEIDILVFHLISESKYIKGITNYEVANKLSLTESKVKGLILESSLKHNPADHKAIISDIVNRLIEEVNKPDFNNGDIQISLENPVDKREFEHAVKEINGYVQYTLNKEVLKISPMNLLEIICDNVENGEEKFKKIIENCGLDKQKKDDITNAKTLVEKFSKFNEFASTAIIISTITQMFSHF